MTTRDSCTRKWRTLLFCSSDLACLKGMKLTSTRSSSASRWWLALRATTKSLSNWWTPSCSTAARPSQPTLMHNPSHPQSRRSQEFHRRSPWRNRSLPQNPSWPQSRWNSVKRSELSSSKNNSLNRCKERTTGWIRRRLTPHKTRCLQGDRKISIETWKVSLIVNHFHAHLIS